MGIDTTVGFDGYFLFLAPRIFHHTLRSLRYTLTWTSLHHNKNRGLTSTLRCCVGFLLV